MITMAGRYIYDRLSATHKITIHNITHCNSLNCSCRRCSIQVFWCQPDSEITSLAQLVPDRIEYKVISRSHINSFSLLLHITSVILLPFNQPDPRGLHHWSLSFTHHFSQISRSRNAHSGMQLLTCGINFRHLNSYSIYMQVLSHLSLIHIMDQSVTCLTVHLFSS